MKKKNLLDKAVVLTILLVFIGTSVAPLVSSGIDERHNDDPSDVYIVDNPTIELTISNLEFEFGSISIEEGEYSTIELPEEGFTPTIGQARLPMIRFMVEIPQGANPDIEIQSIQWESTSLQDMDLPSQIVPMQPSLLKEPGSHAEFTFDDEYYSMNSYTPNEITNIVYIGEIRERRFALIEIAPVLYKPLSGELKLMIQCDLRIDLPNSNLPQTFENILRYGSPSFEQLFQASFENYGQFENMIDGSSKDPEGYLIIVYDNFYEEIQPFASWKQTMGFDVTVTKTSDIPGGPFYTNIESYIDEAYNTWPIPPTYVLLVGDTAQIPTKTSGLQGGVSCSDLYYADITGHYFPELFIGRFPAATESQVTSMVDKTIYYQQGEFPSYEWLTSAAFIASDDMGGLAEETHNFVIETFLEPNQWLCDRIYESSGGSTIDIFNSLNAGRILCIYSGHGYPGGWGCVPFDQSDVNNLANLGMYPFVGSHACSTNTFDDPECFGETWLRVENKGGLAFYGASASTYWDEDDWLERNYFSAWWIDGLENIGAFTVQGMIYTVDDIGGPYVGLSQYYFEAYNLHGDPSLEINAIEFVWEDDVGAVEINYPPENTSGGSTTVNATIGNFGINDQYNVPVSCEIFPGGEIIYFKDFEPDNGGFTPGGTSLWQWGTPTTGPGGAHSGSKCWGTNLYGDYPDYANAWLDSQSIQLPTGDATELSFWHWYNIESYYDGGNVKISTNGGSSWEILGSYLNPYNEAAASSYNEGIPGEPCFSGTSGGWEEVTFDLGEYSGEEIILRWHFGSDYSINYAGWFIDDVTIDTVFSDIPVYSESTTVDILSNTTEYVEFTPPWFATSGTYLIKVKTELPNDQKPSNDEVIKIVTVQDFILDLIDFPMYEAEEPYNEMCGPAVAQMTLNYIWWNNSQDPMPPMTFDDQTWLYESGIENNSNPNLDYFDLQGMWHIIQYNKPMPYEEYGYNFNKRHDTDQNEMLKQICQWINYTVGTYGGHKEGHPYHVPSIIPAYGDYSNWMAVRGIHTDQYAYPMPENLTIYGFWMNDPYPVFLGGIGENSYKDITAFTDDYYIAMTTGDYIGEYLAVLEPPESTENCDLHIGESKPRFTYYQSIILEYVRSGHNVPENIRRMTNEWIVQAAIDGVLEQLVPFDSKFAELFEQTIPDTPYFVMSFYKNDYYVVPFNLPSDDTVIVILIDADDGSFKEASWVEKPVRYLPISRDDAQQIAFDFVGELDLETEDIGDLQPELVHRKSSPYYPEWQVLIQNYGIYVGQDGVVTYIIFK